MAINGKKPTNTQITARLDRLAREIAFKESGGRCQVCGSSEKVQWCHIVQRKGHKALRWSKQNTLILCLKHHSWLDRVATARQQHLFVESVSPGSFDWLEGLDGGVARNEKKFDMTIDDMVELANSLKAELDGLKK